MENERGKVFYMMKKFARKWDFRKFWIICWNWAIYIPTLIVFPVKLAMFTLFPLRVHPIWWFLTISWSKVFYMMKKFARNVEYMTRIIFPGGNPNRRQAIFELCRRVPGPSEHANIIQKYVLCDQISRTKKFARKCRIYDQNYFSWWQCESTAGFDGIMSEGTWPK